MDLSKEHYGIIYRIDPFANETVKETFDSGWGNYKNEIYEKIIINSAQVEELEKLVKNAIKISLDEQLCGHTPPYAIELIDYNNTYFKTSFCFECDNWVQFCNGKYHLLELDLQNGQLLFEWFQKLLPLKTEN